MAIEAIVVCDFDLYISIVAKVYIFDVHYKI